MTALIILAAGKSSRLGFPKQTLLYKGKTLIESAIEAGLKSKCELVTVILGANADKIESLIKHYSIKVIRNNNWAEGIALSIKSGIESLKENTDVNSAIIMLCDQPFVNQAVIDKLLDKHQETGKTIVASAYGATIGVPALFHKSLFTALLALKGNEGAKKILANRPDDVAIVPFKKGIVDIDTIADYENLLK